VNDSGMTLTDKFNALNSTDLSGLKKRIDALRAQAEADLKRAGKVDQTASNADIKQAAAQAGVTIEEFMAALERAKKMGLI
jgi:NACalpha-BTF3-like transcription factor